MRKRLLIIGIAVGMNAGVALAQHENMPGHKNMPPGDQATPSAAGPGKTSSQMTPELKKDIADMYQKMADCMRTDKSMDQCSQEAMKHCPVVEKTGHCPINEGTGPMMGKRVKQPMGGMGMGMGMGNKKKDGNADKKQPPKPDDQQHKGHAQP